MGKIGAFPQLIPWRILVERGRSAAGQMARDEALARDPVPSVRFFTWRAPAISLGWKQPAPEWLAPSRWAAAGLEWVERPTGGGIACHGSDLSLAVVVPRESGAYLGALMRVVCESAARLCRTYGADATVWSDPPTLTGGGRKAQGARRITYCLTEVAPYAVLLGGRKVAGFALRRFPQTWLVQGSLLVRALPRALMDAMPAPVARRLAERAIPLVRAATAPMTEEDVARRWARRWPSWWDSRDCPRRGLSLLEEQQHDHDSNRQLPEGR